MAILSADCGLRMEISDCGWSSIDKEKGKYLDVAVAGGWSLIDEGNERENIWMWMKLD